MTVTIRAIRQRIDYINAMLKDLGSEQRLHFEHRCDYYALDVTDAEGTVTKTLKTNLTKKQVHDHLYFTEQVLWMLPDPR